MIKTPMAFSRSLIVKGLLGLTGLAAVGGGGSIAIFGEQLGLWEKKQDDSTSTTVNGAKDAKTDEEIDNLGIPKSCNADKITGDQTQTCKLTSDQLKNLKFETKSGSTISVDGLTNSDDTVELTIEDKASDSTNYPKGKKYTLKSTSGTVTIKGVKDNDITLEKDKEVVIREKQDGGLLEKAPEEVDSLGIPKSCNADKVTNVQTQTCKLTSDQLKNLKFEPQSGSPSITVTGLTGKDTVELTVTSVSGDQINYPKGKKYTLTSKDGNLIIKNTQDGDIVLEKNKDVAIRETSSGDKLETVENALGIPKSCETTCQLTKEQFEKLKFEAKSGGGSISIDGLSGSDNKVALKVEDSTDKTNYPKGKKYTLTSKDGNVTIKNTQDGDIVLEKNKGVDFREKESGGKLETALDVLGIPKGCTTGSPCQLTKEQLEKIKFETKTDSPSITVTGLTGKDTVELTVTSVSGDTANYPKGKKYAFSNKNSTEVKISSRDKNITLKASTGTSTFKENEKNKLEEIREVDGFGVPKDCVVEGEECVLDANDMKKIKFDGFSESRETTIEGLSNGNTITLKVEDAKQDRTNYYGNKKYSFTNKTTSQVKVKNGSKTIILHENVKTTSFTDYGSKLMSVREVDQLGIPKDCVVGECNITLNNILKMKFEGLNDSGKKASGDSKSYKLKIVSASAPSNKKTYIITGLSGNVTISGGKSPVTLEKDKENKFVEVNGKLKKTSS